MAETKKSIEPESQKIFDEEGELAKYRNLIAELKKEVVRKNA